MDKLPFDLNSLRAFIVVCEGASMLEAARSLGVTQSAVSQLIKGLEKQIGKQLFDRDFRPVQPTALGLVLLELAKDLLNHAQNVAERLSTHNNQVQIRLGCVDSFSATVSPALVRALSGKAKEISLWSGLTPNLSLQLQNRELDLAICTDMSMIDNRISHHLLFSEMMVAVVPRGFSKGKVKENHQELFDKLPLMRYSRRSIIGQQVERYLRHIGLNSPRRFEFDMTDTLLDMVCAGEGYAITTPLCLWQSRHFIESLEVIELPDSVLKTRNFFLLNRADEWENLAREVVTVTQSIVKQTILPSLLEVMPSLPKSCIQLESR